MNQNPQRSWERLFKQVPADVTPQEDHVRSLRRKVLREFDEVGTSGPRLAVGFRSFGEALMRYKAPQWTVAAMLLVSLVWFSQSGRTANAFERVVESLSEARTARFDMEITVEGRPAQKMKAYYLEPGRFRQELGEGHVNISDWEEGKIVGLDPHNKRATVFNLVGLSDEKREQIRKSGNQFEAMRELLNRASTDPEIRIEKLGSKVVDNGVSPMTVWADRISKLPVRIESTMPGPPRTKVVMTHYEFDVDLDDALFSLDVPEGYELSENEMDVTPANESDFLDSLRMACDIEDGQFPDSIDTVGLSNLAAKFVRKMGIGKEGPDKEQMQRVIKLTRGLSFVSGLSADTEAHYAGRGAKLNEKERIVFWYRPEGKEASYRVIHADLTVSAASVAPMLPDAIRVVPNTQ